MAFMVESLDLLELSQRPNPPHPNRRSGERPLHWFITTGSANPLENWDR